MTREPLHANSLLIGYARELLAEYDTDHERFDFASLEHRIAEVLRAVIRALDADDVARS